MNRIKVNDTAMVIAGNDAGRTGKVLRILPDKNKIVLEGIKLGYKHVRKSQQNPQGGRIEKEAPVALSNVLPYCEKCEKGIKVKIVVTKNGAKRRACKACDTLLPL